VRLRRVTPRVAALAARVPAPASGGGEQERNRTRDALQPWRSWYKTARWQKLRREVLLRDGLRCQATGVMLVGRHPAPNSPVVDHIVPHRGCERLFWAAANLQAVSKAWHDSEKQRIEAAAR
jgi:5-methylcytosine-specific restriction endonuclease McrA